MKHFTAAQKHEILLEHRRNSRTHSFAALAARHNVAGGEDVVRKWHSRWDGSAASLEEKHRPGRPRILSREEVDQYVAPKIRAKNRAHQRVHYSDILEEVEEESGKELSLRTAQRYGEEDLKARKKRGKKRTADESKCTITPQSLSVLSSLCCTNSLFAPCGCLSF
jgi:transposase